MEQNQRWQQKAASRSVSLHVEPLPFAVREAFNVLRGNIQLSGFDLKTISVTSALMHEGKSSVSFYLARSFATLKKKTLYLDCDIRNSTTISRYRIEQKTEGLSEFLCGRIPLLDIIYRTDDPYLDMIFTGSVAPNPSELVSSPMFGEMLAYVRERYDYVIVDTPPINAVIDGAVISKQCDGTIFVVESGLTDRMQAVRAKRQLEYAGVKVLGAILNKVDTGKGRYGRYGKHYGYGYGYGYGYAEGEKDAKKS